MRRPKRLLLVGVIAILVAAATGCANVKPWEREALAREDMAWDPDPGEAAIRSHIHFSKEASLGAGGSGGGGCGCN
jgi:hypothetical protein